MTKKITRELRQDEKNLMEEVSRLDETLEIMERHSDEMVSTEEGIKEEMRKWDREHKDAHLHSIPRSKKHVR